MKLIYFLLLLGSLSFLTGWIFLQSITVHPIKIYSRVFILVFLISISLLIIALSVIAGYIALPITVSLFFFISGYLLNTYRYLSQQETKSEVEIKRDQNAKQGHIAIVYFTHGEPETYNPMGWLNQFREFDKQGVRFIPFFARPFFIYMLRKKYLQVGKSNHRQGHIAMLRKLEERYRQEGDLTTRFYLSFLDDYPHLDSAVIHALNDGASSIVVLNVFLTISNHTAEGKKLVDNLDCKKRFGVDIYFSEPLWNSEKLMSAFSDKLAKNIGDIPKEKVAVALVGHGQPAEWDAVWPTLTEQELSFRDGIIEMLVSEGYTRSNISKAWMEFKDPKPYDLMEKFVNNGVEKIFYFAASISADAIHSQADIPELVNRYPFPKHIEVINLGAWNDHTFVIQAIKERADKQLALIRVSH